jgi:hypothetical protein
VATLASASWADIELARADACALGAPCVQVAAQSFAAAMHRRFEGVALARLFICLPFKALPAAEAQAATAGGEPLPPDTVVLCLLGTAGGEPAWNERLKSVGHRAIPLSAATIERAPMVAKLLADLNGGSSPAPPEGMTIRLMATRGNGIFHVEDALTAKDHRGRSIIDRKFVDSYGIESVFGMAGPYLDGVNVIAILFSQSRVERAAADRYGSLINSFKMATARLYTNDKIWAR